MNDAVKAMQLLGTRVINPIKMFIDHPFPDTDVIFIAPNHSREELIEVLKIDFELHVGYETLELLENYTGVRKRC